MKRWIVLAICVLMFCGTPLPGISQEDGMALKYAIYRSKKIGAGTRRDPYRPKIADHIPFELPDGTNYWNWIHPAASAQYVLVYADEATLALVDADPDNLLLSSKVDSIPLMQEWLNGAHTQIPSAGEDSMTTDGCSVAWVSPSTTARQVFRYLLKSHNLAGALDRFNDPDFITFLRTNLDTKMSGVPLAIRNKVRNWMQSKGLDTTWITNNSTVRQVLHYILETIDWSAPGIGPLRF